MVPKHLLFLLFIPAVSFATECSQLTLSSNTEYPPYLWLTKTQPAKLEGSLVALVERLSHASGLDMQVVYMGPWARTQEQAYTGKLDLLGVFHTEPRTEWLDYLQPALLPTSVAIWVNKLRPFEFNQLADLTNLTGITVTSNSLGQEFDNYVKENLNISEVSSVQQGLLMIEEQRADYLVYERVPGHTYALQLNTKDVIPLETPVSRELLYLAVSKQSKCNTPAIKEKLTAALKQAEQEHWAEEFLAQAQIKWLRSQLQEQE